MLDIFRKNSDFCNAFLKNARIIAFDGNCKTYEFDYAGRHVILKKTLKKATKKIIVTCSGRSVGAAHLYPVSLNTVASEFEFDVDVADMLDGNTVAIVVISGKPGLIKGLDEGIFVSASGQPKDKKFVYVMSEARFRSFELKE